MVRRGKEPAIGRLTRLTLQVLAALLGLVGTVANTGVAVGLAVALVTVACMAAQFDGGGERGGGLRRLGRFAVVALVLAPVLAGLMVLVGDATWPIVLLGAIGAGWHVLRRRRRPTPEPDANATEPADDLLGLSDAELGRAWRHSHARLRRVHDVGQLDRLCALRRRQLDEMERRCPTGFQRRLQSGGWVTGGAAPFLES